MDRDFIKQSIEEQRDVRRNLWISVIAISGALTGIIFSTNKISHFDVLLFIKSVMMIIGFFIIIAFVQEVICCNKEIKKLLRLYNKEK